MEHSPKNDGDARTPRSPRFTIEVTDEIIADGVERNSSHCVVAEAVKASYPDAKRVSVDLQTIRFSDYTKGLRYTYLTPRAAQVALVQFDQGIKPEPFKFQLRTGQVTKAGSGTGGFKRERESVPSKAKMKTETTGGGGGEVPTKVGGRTPPRAALGNRRSFGLRSLEL